MNQEEYYMYRLERLAFISGAASIPATFFLPAVAPFFLGSMAIVFAVLSKGGSQRFSKRGKRAVILGATAIVMNLVYVVFAFKTVRTLLADPAGRQEISDMLYRQYGVTLEELLPELKNVPFLNVFSN